MKIAIYGDSVLLATSYGKTSQKLLRALSRRGHETYNFALQHAGAPVPWENSTIYHASDEATFTKALNAVRPDAVVHLRDNWVMTRFYRQPYHLWPPCQRQGTRLFNYTPIQSWPLPSEYIDTTWNEADYTITMTNIGMQKLIEQGAPADRLFYLYHGADADQFHFMEERPSRSLLSLPVDYAKHMITFIGLNQDHRKMIPLAILAFSIYAEKYDPDAFLYLHTDNLGFFDIGTHVKALDLHAKGKVFLRPSEGMGSSMWGFTDEQMGLLYNMSDCLVTMTTAEGFNMPSLESIACGTPVVMTDTPVHRELFERFDIAHFVPSRKIFPNAYTLEWLADPDAAADLIHEAVVQGRHPVSLPPDFRWDEIAIKLENILHTV